MLERELESSEKRDKQKEKFSRISDHCHGSKFGLVVRSLVMMKSIEDRFDPGRDVWRPVSGLYKDG